MDKNNIHSSIYWLLMLVMLPLYQFSSFSSRVEVTGLLIFYFVGQVFESLGTTGLNRCVLGLLKGTVNV